MIGKTHLLFGILLGIFYLDYFKFSGNKVLFFIIIGLASLLPDIDHPNSIIGRKIKPISSIINFLFGHRKLLHSIFFLAAVGLLSFLLWPLYFIPTFIGLLSHILLDTLSKEGLNLLYPFNIIDIKGFIKVGGLIENLFFFCLLILIVLKVFFLILNLLIIPPIFKALY